MDIENLNYTLRSVCVPTRPDYLRIVNVTPIRRQANYRTLASL